MTPGILESFVEKSEEYEDLFNKLCTRAKDDLELSNCIEKVKAWLKECVDHGRFLPERSSDRKDLQSLVNYWTSLLRQHGYEVLEIGRLAPFDSNAGVPLEGECPYPGLQAYDKKRQADFFGREKDTETCVAALEANRILMIVGGSGSGKSSLALAGILPKLIDDYADWQFVPPFTPGAKPFDSLGGALAKALGNSADASTIAERLRQQPDQAALVLSEIFGAGKPVMLLIDQFEELLTLCQEEQEQKAFSELLCGLVPKSGDNNIAQESDCRILLTLRTDHLARFETNPSLLKLFNLVSENSKQLAAMDFASIHQAIEIPAKKKGLRFLPPEIIDALASQTASLVDGLPLLQFALQRLWEERPTVSPRKDENGNKVEEKLAQLDFINEESFKKLPDVQSALGKVAEEIYQLFDDKKTQIEKLPDVQSALGKVEEESGKKKQTEKQKLCERLMLELVLLDENFEQPLRRRRSKAELLEILVRRWPETTVNEVIDVFVKQGLLRYSGSNEAQQLEVAHEAMFRNWETFRDWISGPEPKARLHAVKLIGREALDWRVHEKSPDYLKLSGEPLKSAQEYVMDYWLVDKDSTDYIKACDEQEQKIEEQRKLAEQAEMLAQKAKIALIKTWFAFAGLAAVIIAVTSMFLIYKSGQKTAALISLPLVASKLPPSESMDVTYSVAQKGGNDFRYVLAHALENMEDRYLFLPRKSNIMIAGQGTAIIQLDNSNQKDQNLKENSRKSENSFSLWEKVRMKFLKSINSPPHHPSPLSEGDDVFKGSLKVFRVCEDGRVDKNFAEIPYERRQLVADYVDIAPPSNQPGKNDNRLIILPFKRETPQRGWDVEVYRLNWQHQPCAEPDSKKTGLKSLTPEVKSLDSAKKSLDDVDDISPMAFDANGKTVAFSAITYQPKPIQDHQNTKQTEAPKPESTVWVFDENWKPVSFESTTLSLTDDQLKNNEDVVSAVAFTRGEPGQSPEPLLITGRLNGALYCGNNPQRKSEESIDPSPVQQIFTNHSRFGTEGGDWFVYRHKSGKVGAKQCNSTQKEEVFAEDIKKDIKNKISFVSINYIPIGADKQIKPVVTYVNNKQPSCWIKKQKWTAFNCSSTHVVEQFVIAPDAKHLVAIEPGGEKTKAAVHNFSQEFLSDDDTKQWVGKLLGEHLIVWPKSSADGNFDDEGKTSWSDQIKRFVAKPSPGVEILEVAMSPAEKYIAWLERKSMANEINLRVYAIKANKYMELHNLLNFEKDNIIAFDLAVTDNGEIVLAINEKLRLFTLTGEVPKEVHLERNQAETSINVEPNVSCLELSPDNEKIVIGTRGGELRLFNLSKRSFETSKTEFEHNSHDSSKDFVSACAVDNTGMMVGGFANGSVRVVKANSSFPLSPLAVYQFKKQVKAVSIDSQQGYVAALFDWQTSDCTANGLPGQSIRIWGYLENRENSPLISTHWVPRWLVSMFGKEERFPLISNSCFPNRHIMSIGSITEQKSKMFLSIAFDDGHGFEPLLCRGCANKTEKPADVLEKLLEEATNKKAEIITDEQLEERYGIKF